MQRSKKKWFLETAGLALQNSVLSKGDLTGLNEFSGSSSFSDMESITSVRLSQEKISKYRKILSEAKLKDGSQKTLFFSDLHPRSLRVRGKDISKDLADRLLFESSG
eukprot:GHVP01038331.1.p1 GENE.GHVP01038331.1~~GHVP01038331.1.p1  ORF type:complete len:107 (+),score=23.71 GHVP01038331.1:77-397(+)